MNTTAKFLLDHGLTLLAGAFAGAAITLATNNLEAIGFWGCALVIVSILAFVFRRLLGRAQSKLSKALCSYSRIITRRLLSTMPRKGDPKLRIEYLPVALLFFMIGIGLTASWKWEFWSVTSSIGSLLAGIGAVGLLWFGWVKANEWLHQKRIDLVVEQWLLTNQANYDLIISYDNHVIPTVVKKALEFEGFALQHGGADNKSAVDIKHKEMAAIQSEVLNNFFSKITLVTSSIDNLATIAPESISNCEVARLKRRGKRLAISFKEILDKDVGASSELEAFLTGKRSEVIEYANTLSKTSKSILHMNLS